MDTQRITEMDPYIDKENSFGQQRLQRRKKSLSARKRALQTIEETNTPFYEEISTKKSEHVVAVEPQAQLNTNSMSAKKLIAQRVLEQGVINPSDSSVSGSNSVGKFKMLRLHKKLW